MNLINTIYRIHTIGKQTHTYNKMSDILNILNQFNNTPKKPKEDKIESVESTESVIKKIVPPITSLDTFVARELQEILKPKISIIMQAYLGEYNGSRSNSIEKFIRAVESFNQQIYKNCELIIVADGCINTFNTYMAKYQSNPNIKIAYVDKKGVGKMYDDVTEDKKFYRGLPRQIGLEMATGEIVTYMDSDDFLMPKFTLSILSSYNMKPEADWYINRSWYDNIEADWEKETVFASYDRSKAVKIDGIPSKWVATKLKDRLIILSPWLLTHKRNLNIKWRDTIGNSEDVDFNTRMRLEYKNGFIYETPTYVRCHYTNQWDY
jgi:glycosyltransferase involved in cell wall biosynthesis